MVKHTKAIFTKEKSKAMEFINIQTIQFTKETL